MRFLARIIVLAIGVAASIGVGVALNAALVAQSQPLASLARPAYDAMATMLSTLDNAQAAPRVTFLDFDDFAYQRLGQPAVTPRDAVSELVDAASAGGAQSIMIDIDLTQEAIDPAARDALVETIRAAAARTPIVLVRTAGDGARRGGDAPVFDALVEATDRVAWGGGEVAFDDDGVIRRAPLAYCGADGLRPSIFQLGQAFGVGAGGALDGQVGPGACGASGAGLLAAERFITYPFRLRGPDGRIGDQPGLRRIGVDRLLGDETVLGANGFAGDVVLIGASHRASADLVGTPVGDMPGSLVIANAVGGWMRLGAPLAPPQPVEQAAFSALFAVVAFVAIRLRALVVRNAGFVRRALFHPVLIEKLILLALFGLWLALLANFVGQGLWFSALIGGAVASFLFFVLDDFGPEVR